MSENIVIVERVENNVIVSSSGVQGPQGVQGVQGIQGIQGDPGIGAYTHTQDTASNSWTINHNLGFFPNVEIVDSAGSAVIGNYQFINANTLVATFRDPFAGKAYLS
jgi:hypothetical protein